MGLKIIKVVTGKKVGGNLGFFFFPLFFNTGVKFTKYELTTFRLTVSGA